MSKKLANSLFSKSELKILKIIGRKKQTIKAITSQYYKRVRLNGKNNQIAVTIRRIKSKCKLHDLNWTLNGKGGGRGGRVIWRKYV